MFQAMRMLFIMVESPLHAGMGRGLGAVDLPIQRERTTQYPMVQASGLKGCLRAAAYEVSAQKPAYQQRLGELTARYEAEADQESDAEKKQSAKRDAERRARREAAKEAGLEVIFGPETADASDHAGALSTGDARLLLFPVRSLAGVFAWTTSLGVLARFCRQAETVGLKLDSWQLPSSGPGDGEAWVADSALAAGNRIVLEEYAFVSNTTQSQFVQNLGSWLASNALPAALPSPQQGQAQPVDAYQYWRTHLPSRLCILPENAFRDFTLYATEVETHVRLDPATKTVQTGALWTAESLPMDTLLYAPLMASPSRATGQNLSAAQVLQKVADLNLTRLQLGGDETTGQGMVALRLVGGS